jgi:transposase InsO family protein
MHLENPTKKELSQSLGVARSSLYYQPKLPEKDWQLKIQIEQVLHDNPSYGHRRIADALHLNHKRIRRVMRLFGLKPYRRRGKKLRKKKDVGQITAPFENLLKQVPFPDRPGSIWVSDFTHIAFRGRWVYLATIMDLYSREVVGWAVYTCHSVQLVMLALIDALEKYQPAHVLHSDQGAEYKSRLYTSLAESARILLSMSRKSSPWENGYQESFYGQLKVDLGDTNRYQSLGELTAAIYHHIHYYNHTRIHTALKMPPATFAARRRNQLSLTSTSIQRV